MWVRLRRDWIWAFAATAGLVVLCVRTLPDRFSPWADYWQEARPAFDALVNGNVGEFLHRAPAYGGSLLLRAPAVLVAGAFGAGQDGLYRASAIPALLACGTLAWWLARRTTSTGRARPIAQLVVVGVLVLNPLAEQALLLGHPEELLGAVLCVAAVLCAVRDRPIWAGVLLGLAIANKEWALLAVGPVLVAVPRRRWLSLACAAAVAGLILTPFAIAGAFTPNQGLQGQPDVSVGTFTPWQVWWFFGRGWLPRFAHPVIVGISIPVTLIYVHRLHRGRRVASDPLLLLAFLFLLRCVLDPWDHSYYAAPFLIALVAWEALRCSRVPVLAAAASILAWLLYVKLPFASLSLSLDTQALCFLLVSLSAEAAMALGLYAPGGRARLVRRVVHRASIEPPLEAN